MLVLILGVALWWAAHLFKRVAPAQRAAMGEVGKGVVAVALVLSIVLMVMGYRAADFIYVWAPPTFMVHINNLLMLIAFFIFGTSATTGRLRGWTRHPQLIAFKTWAVAHLIVNGDLASIVLFGGLLAWAVCEVIVINRSEPEWQRPEPGPASKDVLLVVITLVAFSVTAGIHAWLGVWPFPG